MSNDLIFFVPYHTGYAHIEILLSFLSFADVHLFIYNWNPARSLIQQYFSESQHVHTHEFSLEHILSQLVEQERLQKRVIILLTASLNYSFGQSQFRYFCNLQKYTPSMIDVYSTGHCMYGCQSCTHANSHRLPITFTNYIRTIHTLSSDTNTGDEVLICPSFSSEDDPNSLLSNTQIIEDILAFSFAHTIKLHPLTYSSESNQNPLFSLSSLEQANVEKLLTSKSIVPANRTNTLKLIAQARILICDLDSSIPFEALYFNDRKYIFAYERTQLKSSYDDRRPYFHIFRNAQQLKELLDRYFLGLLECKTDNSHKFFLEKYDEPDGEEIKRLASLRNWTSKPNNTDLSCDIENIGREMKQYIQSSLTQMDLYAIGEHSPAEIDKLCYGDIDVEFKDLMQNIDDI